MGVDALGSADDAGLLALRQRLLACIESGDWGCVSGHLVVRHDDLGNGEALCFKNLQLLSKWASAPKHLPPSALPMLP